VAALPRTPPPADHEQADQERHEEILGILSHEAQEVLQPVVVVGEAVERLVDREIDVRERSGDA
jgi:hypothetical protein